MLVRRDYRRRSRVWLALCIAAAATAAMPVQASAEKTVWLCKPGLADNPCKPGLDTTIVSPTGEVIGVEEVDAVKRPEVDCFYVYPTVSDDEGSNSDLSIDPEERSIALYQAARYSRDCRVFAPLYRQITIDALFSGQPITEEMAALAYGDVAAAWKTYLRRHNDGRGFVLIGHSQGTIVLRKLVRQLIDRKPAVRERLISALLLGGNVEVAEGAKSGGDFRNIAACRRAKQLACAVAFSTFNAAVPPDARFGRVKSDEFEIDPGRDPATRDILCTNPAALGGGVGVLDPVLPSEPFAPGTTIGAGTEATGLPDPEVSTPWIEFRGAYSAQCSATDDADVLQLTSLNGAPTLNALPDATWGLHLADANIALGNLARLVRRQIKAYAKAAD